MFHRISFGLSIHMILLIKTTLTYISWIIIFIIFTIILFPLALLPAKIRHNRLFFFISWLWNKLLVLSSFINIKIDGKNNLPKYPNSPSIIIANHSSALDIFLIESILSSYPRTWLCKDSYAKIPIFGTIAKRMHVPVKRENPKQAIRALFKVCEIAKLGPKHIILFPEGTRHSDGKIHTFLPGFAILAKKLNYPVIPIAIKGVNKIFPKKSLLVDSKAKTAKLIVGKPFFYNNQKTQKEFIEKVENWFKDMVED